MNHFAKESHAHKLFPRVVGPKGPGKLRMTSCRKNLRVAFEEELEEPIRFDGWTQAPQDLLIRLFVGHIVLEEYQDALAQSLLVHLAVKLGAIDGFSVEANKLIRAHIGFRKLDPAGTELTDPVIVAELNVKSVGELGEQRIGDAGRRELNRKGADFRFLLVLDDGAATEIRQELVAPTGAENRAAIIEQTLSHFPKRSGEGMFPSNRECAGPSNQNCVGILDVLPTDIRIINEVDELELVPGHAATIDKAALLLLE